MYLCIYFKLGRVGGEQEVRSRTLIPSTGKREAGHGAFLYLLGSRVGRGQEVRSKTLILSKHMSVCTPPQHLCVYRCTGVLQTEPGKSADVGLWDCVEGLLPSLGNLKVCCACLVGRCLGIARGQLRCQQWLHRRALGWQLAKSAARSGWCLAARRSRSWEGGASRERGCCAPPAPLPPPPPPIPAVVSGPVQDEVGPH